MPLARPLAGFLAAAALAGCGGSETADRPVEVGAATTEADAGGSLPAWVEERLAARGGPDIALVMGGADFAVGSNRVTFLVVRNDGDLVQAPTATVHAGAETGRATVTGEAVLEPLGPHSHGDEVAPHDHPEARDLYVAHLELPASGRWWLVVDPVGEDLQAVGAIDVSERTATPPVGSRAPASDNPTLADGPAEEITTARPPDVELLRHSIADSLADDVPFVVVFATPQFCESRTCGPTVEVVEKVREEFAASGIRFIHVEIYEDNDPKKGFNRWVREWTLPTEPWVFLVDGAGVIRAKFEGSVSARELEQAVREHLLTGA